MPRIIAKILAINVKNPKNFLARKLRRQALSSHEAKRLRVRKLILIPMDPKTINK